MNNISDKHIRWQILALTLTCALTWAGSTTAQPTDEPAVTLTADTQVATAGYFQLRWNALEAVRLLESETADFARQLTVYEGFDSGHAVSGRSDGELFYRLESATTGARLGEPVHVVVAHHSRGRAFAFFGVGAIVFLATLALIVFGSRRNEL